MECFNIHSVVIWPGIRFLSFQQTTELGQHGQGSRVLLYLDDGIVAMSGKSEAKEASDRVRRDFKGRVSAAYS